MTSRPLFCSGWRTPLWLRSIWEVFASESTGKRRNERLHRTKKGRFSWFFAPWPWQWRLVHFYSRVRQTRWLRLIWDILQANRPVNEELRGYTEPVIYWCDPDFSVFSLCDLDLWLLDQTFWWVTRASWNAANWRLVASELAGKRRIERIQCTRDPKIPIFMVSRSITRAALGGG